MTDSKFRAMFSEGEVQLKLWYFSPYSPCKILSEPYWIHLNYVFISEPSPVAREIDIIFSQVVTKSQIHPQSRGMEKHACS